LNIGLSRCAIHILPAKYSSVILTELFHAPLGARGELSSGKVPAVMRDGALLILVARFLVLLKCSANGLIRPVAKLGTVRFGFAVGMRVTTRINRGPLAGRLVAFK
jgi:hypothetical protein